MWTSCERNTSRSIETTINGNDGSGMIGATGSCVIGSSQHETLADIEHISTIAGSLVSIGSISHTQPQYGTNDAGYDTEHTSLNSDFDEAELRRELLRDKWKLLFDMFDPEGFGEITVDEFITALKSPEFISQVPMNKRELLLERAKKAKSPVGPGYITFQDFVNVLFRGNPRLHQDIKIMEEIYQCQWDRHMKGKYRWNLQRDCPSTSTSVL